MARVATETNCWAIVLAGGEGTRVRPFIESWLGAPRPKQYCSFFGDASMLESTLERAIQLTAPDRVLTVTGPGHGRYLAGLGNDHLPGRLLEQPRNLETAPGVFLPLAYVMAKDPAAAVVLMPSDHFVAPTERIVEQLARAVRLTEVFPPRIVLLGAIPDGPETDFGWIEPGDLTLEVAGARPVRAFREKPGADLALDYYRRGFLWNTMISVCRARTLWRIGKQTLPDMLIHFERFRRVIQSIDAGRAPRAHEQIALEDLYRHLEPANFSSDLLEKVADCSLVMPLESIHWSDWGRPERIHASLARLGAEPNFGASLAQAAENTERHAAVALPRR